MNIFVIAINGFGMTELPLSIVHQLIVKQHFREPNESEYLLASIEKARSRSCTARST